jgi:hypothetical protein
MKPLHVSQIESFNRRFNHLIDSELRRVDILSPTTMSIVLSVQDENRAFDWINLELEISGVSDARLIDENKISFVDMSDGISILYEDNNVIISVGKYSSFESANNAPLYIKGDTLKYQENTFNA